MKGTVTRMKRGGRVSGYGRLLGLAGLLAALPAGAFGQELERGRIIAEGRAGAAFPIGRLADIADAGPAFGAGVAYFFHPNIGVGADVSASLLSASETDPFDVVRVSDVDLIHFGAALVFDFSPPSHQDEPFTFRASVWNGLTSMSAEQGELDFSATYYTVAGLGRIGYRIRPDLELFLGTDVFVVMTDGAETQAFFQGPNQVEPMNLALSIPVTIGVKAKLR